MNLGPGVDALARFLAGPEPAWWASALAACIVWLGPLLLIVLPIAALGQIIERKVAAAMQRRHGPNTAGLDGLVRFLVRCLCWFLPRATQERLTARLCRLPGMQLARRLGLGQLVADGIKMLGKEDLIPGNADGWVFRLAPYLAMCGALLPFAAIPFGQHLVALEVPVAALYVAAAGGLTVIALFMAGWGSGNKFSLLGGMRAVAQVVSYEIPVGLAIAGVVLWCGSMDLQRIVASQYNAHWASFLGWNFFQSPFLALLAVILFVAGLAECQRTPFDMAEAESELVSGFNTEYSGLRWGLFAMAEYAEMFLVGAIIATLFLGGYQSPFGEPAIIALPAWLAALIHALMLTLKASALLFVMVWLRWTLPRLRVDQVMRLCWITLVPLALLALFGVALTMLAAGSVAPGSAYGRIPALPELHLTPLAHALAWVLPVAIAALLIVLARRQHGRLHPDLARLSGAGR
ncbi:MAG: complex I subunit 1 family protein [Planctomycetota bacterium]|nr:NADH-quinone oxidoreductase subunit H [Planctomycetota bacterium]MDW8373572.1 complex I subunit 1 family protein [Planctomycetota bacterium]